ncbi:argininosuccinate lyase [Patescibacteria group bacterium]|nr:argininosuccinate lyase [Patescibacteria group bacterium]
MSATNFVISDKQLELDLLLAPYDLWATKVHVLMLFKSTIVGQNASKQILTVLNLLSSKIVKHNFTIDPKKGLHLTVENEIIKQCGNYGFSMHTARSRNDQVMTCELLYLREKMLGFFSAILELRKILLQSSYNHIDTVMTGYTHMQPAKPTTFGQWCLSYSDMLGKIEERLKFEVDRFNLCPLGAVESYGTSWPIDREYSATLLGFSGVWEIPQEAISSRGFAQKAYLGVLVEAAVVLSKIAADLLLFNTFEFGFAELGGVSAKQMSAATGSSIMPQKKNPDILELIRSLAPQVTGIESIVANLLSGLPTGYNRDTREIKEYMKTALDKSFQAVESLSFTLKGIKCNKKKMLQAVKENYSMAPELSDFIAQKCKIPYRIVYKIVGNIVRKKKEADLSLETVTPEEVASEAELFNLKMNIEESELKIALDPQVAIQKRKHTGGAAKAVVEKMINNRLKKIKKDADWLKSKWNIINKAKEKTEKEVNKLVL